MDVAAAESRTPIQPGQPAPDFRLPAIDREGDVSLADYLARSPVLLGMFRPLSCAFCRRHIAQLGGTRKKLLMVGVETLAIVASPLERARLYFQFHPAGLPLAADPEMTTHRSYGVPRPPATPEIVRQVKSLYLGLSREMHLPIAEASPLLEIRKAIGRSEGLEMPNTDWDLPVGKPSQVVGQFLVDRDGIVRWTNIEGAKDGLAGMGKFPSDQELLAAARALAG